MNKVSIIIPAYNSASFIAETLASAQAQDIGAVEVIVVDDGSTDDTAEVVEAIPGVRLITQRNAGDAAARQTGLGASTGEFIMFLDHDDLLLPEAARLHLAALDAGQPYDLVVGSNLLINSTGEVTGELRHAPRAFSAREVVLGTTPSFSQCMYRRAALERIGGLRPEALAAADHDLNIRLLGWEDRGFMHGNIVMKYRQHAGQQTRSPARLYKIYMETLERLLGPGGEMENAELLAQAKRHWQSVFGQYLPSECGRMLLRGDYHRAGEAARLFFTMAPRSVPAAVRFWGKRIFGSAKPAV